MDPLTSTAAAGMRARLEALDLLANNLANSSTPGFKADREAYTLYFGEDTMAASESGEGRAQISSPMIEAHRTDYSQGTLTDTHSPNDLALSGDGFFMVDGPNGPLLTRAGNVLITRDGKLATREGYEFSTVEPRRIRIDPLRPFSVDANGTVRQDGAALGRLKLVTLSGNTQPPKREGVYFSLDSRDLPSLGDSRAEVHQGKLEGANFSAPEAAVRLVGVLRQFEALQKALQLGGDMGRKAVEEVARVNP